MNRILLGLLLALTVLASAQAQETGIAVKRPIIAGACHQCPWGAMADVVKAAMTPYGYDVQVCYECAGPFGPRQVSGALVPRPICELVPDVCRARENAPANSVRMNDPLPKGPVDFGATSVQNLRRAYEGKADYAKDGQPRKNLRVFATIGYPNYLLIAATKESGITDLNQLKGRTAPMRVLLDSHPQARAILKFFGHTEESIKAAGGRTANGLRDRKDFDLIIFGGTLSNAPEQNVWYEITQKYDLVFLQMPEALLAQLVADDDCNCERANIPIGLLRGVDRVIPTVAKSAHAIYGRDDAPDDFAYTVAKALDEQQRLWMWASIPLYYDPKTTWNAGGLPLHPGAERYYREKGYMK